jgi:hypothetical protein
VVEVDGGVVPVFEVVDVSEPVLVAPVPSPVWPPPVVTPVSPPELVPESSLEVSFEPESEPKLVVDVDVVLVSVLVANGGVATPVVGTVSGGAPLVSPEPEPLPPQAATASATATTAQAEANPRKRRFLAQSGTAVSRYGRTG